MSENKDFFKDFFFYKLNFYESKQVASDIDIVPISSLTVAWFIFYSPPPPCLNEIMQLRHTVAPSAYFSVLRLQEALADIWEQLCPLRVLYLADKMEIQMFSSCGNSLAIAVKADAEDGR